MAKVSHFQLRKKVDLTQFCIHAVFWAARLSKHHVNPCSWKWNISGTISGKVKVIIITDIISEEKYLWTQNEFHSIHHTPSSAPCPHTHTPSQFSSSLTSDVSNPVSVARNSKLWIMIVSVLLNYVFNNLKIGV